VIFLIVILLFLQYVNVFVKKNFYLIILIMFFLLMINKNVPISIKCNKYFV